MSVRSTSEMVSLAMKGDKLQLLVKYGVTVGQVEEALERVIKREVELKKSQRIFERMVEDFLNELKGKS